ncbi:hypothetical protein BV25DRAFT_1991740 [Artomyces pyxidatus]|uniref:Uncharacterized protein n=1 Tax=Artomyces pyxidatus TaxID=48021 RepID=A0ACB8T0R4_9AGAM|nr:hypothetical protein BV25DRAFT_1991740 [Artomyces pyxidatus]
MARGPEIVVKPLHVLPPLAPEIWLDILEWATIVPGLMDIDVPDPFDSPTTLTPNDPWPVDELKASLRLRLALVRVSKSWHAMTTPILYRCLVVRTKKAAERIIQTLRDSHARVREGSAGPPLGHWVHHLMIALPAHERVENFGAVASLFPNLQILTANSITMVTLPTGQYAYEGPVTTSKERPWQMSFLRGVLAASGKSLLRLCVGGLPYHDRVAASALLQMAPNLRTLLTLDDSLCPIDLFRPPKLATLNIHGSCNDANAVNEPFPFVRHAVLRDPGFYRSSEAWLRFLTFQGPSLTTLHLDFFMHGFAEFMRGDISSIEILCPNLKHLFIYFLRLPVPFSLIAIPAAPHLGIHFREPPTLDASTPLVEALLRAEFLPRQVVRLLNPEVGHMLRGYLHEDVNSELARAIASGRFGLQDHRGQGIGPLASTSS